MDLSSPLGHSRKAEPPSPPVVSKSRRGPKRPPDRKPYQRTTQAEITQILLLNKQGVSQLEMARITGITQQTISAVLGRHASTCDVALSVLQAASYKAAHDWVQAFPNAVKRGDHRPMRDALIAVGVVAPDAQNHGVTVIVGAGADISVLPSTLALPVISVESVSEPSETPSTDDTPKLHNHLDPA